MSLRSTGSVLGGGFGLVEEVDTWCRGQTWQWSKRHFDGSVSDVVFYSGAVGLGGVYAFAVVYPDDYEPCVIPRVRHTRMGRPWKGGIYVRRKGTSVLFHAPRGKRTTVHQNENREPRQNQRVSVLQETLGISSHGPKRGVFLTVGRTEASPRFVADTQRHLGT